MTQFSTLGLSETLLRALSAEGYTTPTPIQAAAIPHVMAKRDLLGIAQTGTGKTAAFSLPILEQLIKHQRPTPRRGCRVLVLSPTRELASQINENIRSYGRHARVTTTAIYGGIPIGRQIRDLTNGVDILVATPGRLLDLVNQRAVTLEHVEYLVLDEADHMLDLGFIVDIRKLVAQTPKARQTLLFSATMPKPIAELASSFLNDPARVEITPVATTAERVEQQVIFVDTAHKQTLLHKLMENPALDRALVFTRTKHGADKVVRRLEEKGIRAAAIHGNKSQTQRERALADFKAGRLRLLIATDIAARGIDIDAVSHVINFDLPNMPEAYVHRIGRTARAGASGIAISFCDREEHSFLRAIERVTRQQVTVIDNPLGAGLGMPPSPRSERPSQDAVHPAAKRQRQRNRGSSNHTPSNRAPAHRAASGQRHEEARTEGQAFVPKRPFKDAASRNSDGQSTRRDGKAHAGSPAGQNRGATDQKRSSKPWLSSGKSQRGNRRPAV